MKNSAPRPDAVGTTATGGGPNARRRGYAVLLAATLTLPVVATSSSAAVTPVALPYGITLFPERDFLGVEGFPQSPVTIDVFRGDVKVGTASGIPSPDEETGTLLEVNHPGGVCWSGSTPDLLPGDRVEVTVNGERDAAGEAVGAFANVLNVTAEPALLLDRNGTGGRDDLVIRGTATAADGGRLPEELLEQRIVAPPLDDTAVGKRDIRALFTGGFNDGNPYTGDIVWDDPTDLSNTNWTATFTDLGEDIAAKAAAGQTRVLAWERTDVADNRIGMTIYEADEVGGPGMGGCPPASNNGVTGTTPAHVNIAARDRGGNLVISGVSHNAASLEVTLDDDDATSADALKVNVIPNNPASTDPAVPLPGPQTWRTTMLMSELVAARMAEGSLRVSAVYQRVPAETTTRQKTNPDGTPMFEADGTTPVMETVRVPQPINGAEHHLLKDLVRPLPPVVSPPGKSYVGAQSVHISPRDQLEETARWRIGAVGDPAPTASSPAATGPIPVTSSQTLKSVSFDRAGNASEVKVDTYTIRTSITAPQAPTATSATPGVRSATVSWTAPTDDGGAEITSYQVRAIRGSTILTRLTQATGSPVVVPDLTAGAAHTFQVRAVNSAGAGGWSTASSPVTPTAGTTNAAPTVTARTPGVDATGVGAAANVTATFSEAVQGVGTGTFRVTNPAGGAVNATVTRDGTTNRWILNPSANLTNDTRYTVTLAGGQTAIRDTAGAALATTSWTFLTGPRPRVTNRTPASGATAVSRTANVTATFSEDVVGTGTGTAVLRNTATGATINSAVGYAPSTRRLTLNPATDLAANTRYTVTLTPGIGDAAGNPLASTSWSFTTVR